MNIRSTLLSILAVVAFIFSGNATHAQTVNGWDSLDLGQRSGFLDDREFHMQMHFADSLAGWLRTAEHIYRTSDGGLTWTETSTFVGPPIGVMVDSTFGYNMWNITTDGGASWRRFTFSTTDTVLSASVAVSMVAANERNLVVMLHNGVSTYDSVLGFNRSTAIFRIVRTTDGGASWVALDSLRLLYENGRPRLDLASVLGIRLPSRWSNENTRTNWMRTLDMPDSNRLRVISQAYGPLSDAGNARYQYYIGEIDLAARTATWHPMPVWAKMDFNLSDGYLRFGADPNTIIVAEPDATNNGLNDRAIWITTNGGATWDSVRHSPMLDLETLTFLSGGNVATSNASSTDYGRTWRTHAHPWNVPDDRGRPATVLFSAPDPMHLYVSNSNGLFARSIDGGHSWTRNEAGGRPRAVLARDGHVVIGRFYQSALSSTDAGDTWHDAYENDGLPDDLQTLTSLAFADAQSTDRIVAIGMFTEPTGRRYSALLRSVDGGSTWTRGNEVSDSISGTMYAFPAGASERIVVANELTGLWVSDNAGTTWTRTMRQNAYSMVMADANHGVAFFYARGLSTTTDGGHTWRAADTSIVGTANMLAVDALSPDDYRAVVTSPVDRSSVLRSTDRGSTWRVLHDIVGPSDRMPRGTNAHWIDSARVFVGGIGNVPLFYSRNAGRSFARIILPFQPQALADDGRYLYVTRAGNIAARIDLSVEPARIEVMTIASFTTHLDGNLLTITRTDARAADIEIVDMRGRVLERAHIEGAHATLDVSSLASGRYMVRIVDGERVEVRVVSVTR